MRKATTNYMREKINILINEHAQDYKIGDKKGQITPLPPLLSATSQ